jgi:hypothetical protein
MESRVSVDGVPQGPEYQVTVSRWGHEYQVTESRWGPEYQVTVSRCDPEYEIKSSVVFFRQIANTFQRLLR